ncbi:hypothetical protein NQ314_005599 [Rhamnusium bicolor]|uniref:DDE Tnp4 domain-containing protein n=1 Tax=Rhamnusium bicolor TaxID=1586634 RepID=A0AAV8ZHR8_9CUCU|nr:hypothetical protein NQ314_005599 [Rhamnusium bicolor]
MDENIFRKLLRKIEHRITKYSYCRETILATDKLIITLRYLATGESFRSLMYNCRVSESTISLFVPVVSEAIYEELNEEYLKVPTTAAEWLEIARDFETTWNAPNNKQHSIVLLAPVDVKYNFTYINVGMKGRLSDGGVFWNSDLAKAIEDNIPNFPKDKPLPRRTKPVPHVIVADATFSQVTFSSLMFYVI